MIRVIKLVFLNVAFIDVQVLNKEVNSGSDCNVMYLLGMVNSNTALLAWSNQNQLVSILWEPP